MYACKSIKMILMEICFERRPAALQIKQLGKQYFPITNRMLKKFLLFTVTAIATTKLHATSNGIHGGLIVNEIRAKKRLAYIG